MAYNTNEVLKDLNGNTIPQYYNPNTDSYEPLEGSDGSNKVSLLDSTGTDVVSTQIVQPILDKLDQLTGTVLAEENRKIFEDYNPTTQYHVGNKVSYEGSSYYTIVEPPIGTLPTNTGYFLLIAEKGDTGNGITNITDNLDGTITITYGEGQTVVVTFIGNVASNISYENTTSGLTATTVQYAIDELSSEKVDKVVGKQLSTEDYTTAEKNKLAGIETGAEVNNPIANNLTTTVAGSALDATQGKIINDDLVTHKAETVQFENQTDFVELIKGHTSYDKVMVKKVSVTSYEVTAINSNKGVAFQINKGLDDFYKIEGGRLVTVGVNDEITTYADLLYIGSNIELAISLTVNSITNWIPGHGTASVYTNYTSGGIKLFIDGDEVDVTTMPLNTWINGGVITFTQDANVRFSGVTGDIANLQIQHSITRDGVVSWVGNIYILKESLCLKGYPCMLPTNPIALDVFITGIMNEKKSTGDETEYQFTSEKNQTVNVAAISKTNQNHIAAIKALMPIRSMRYGKDYKPENAIFLWQRASVPKIYMQAFENAPLSNGDVYSWGGQLAVGDIPNIYSGLSADLVIPDIIPYPSDVLYFSGDEAVQFTDGWVAGYSVATGSQSKEATYLNLEVDNNRGWRTYVTNKKVDLTNVSNLVIDWEIISNSTRSGYFLITQNADGSGATELIQKDNNFSRGESILDVSSYTGVHYVAASARNYDGTGTQVKIYEISCA